MEIRETLKELTRYHHIKAWLEKYERLLMPATLVLGMIQDWLTFTHINTFVSFVLLAIYLFLAGGIILFLSAYSKSDAEKENMILRYARITAPFFLQFTIGALLSGVFIFYIFSGTFFVSWPFLLFVFFLMLSNEIFRHYYLLPSVQIGVYFFILFSIFSVIFPFVFNSLDIKIFLFAGVSSIVVISLYLSILFLLAPKLRYERSKFIILIVTIFVIINTMYFGNLIPPIPLSIREATLAHDIHKSSADTYLLQVEQSPWWDKFVPGQTFHKLPDESMFVYTAIFAPGNLQTRIIHHWQWYDSEQGRWVSKDKLGFIVSGGRSEGFRGFSQKSTMAPGKWRVDVETERGQVLGRVSFELELSDTVPVLKVIAK